MPDFKRDKEVQILLTRLAETAGAMAHLLTQISGECEPLSADCINLKSMANACLSIQQSTMDMAGVSSLGTIQ